MCWFTITLVGSLISLAVVSPKKSDIILNVARESWITTENLTTLLEVSFNVSNCCNVYVSGKSVTTENIFNEFSRIYKHEYVINERTYNCSGHFLISDSVENLVSDIRNIPTIISTTELLVIVDDDVENTAEIFNALMYWNANVNIAAFNGLWTLSENYLKPRVFKKHSRHTEMAHKRDILNFEGRELHAVTHYQPPFCYLQTRVNRTVNGIEAQFFEAENESELDGIELKLFVLMAERLNCTWTIQTLSADEVVEQSTPHSDNATEIKTSWYSTVEGLVFQKELDIVFSGIWLTEIANSCTNMTTPWTMLDIRFLVPRPRPYTSFWALTRPLSPQVWLAVLVMLIVQSIYVNASAWISSRIAKRFQSFAITWTELMGRLLGTHALKKIEGLEIQFQLWHFIGILLVTAYSSNLAADLTNSKYVDRIDTAQDFVKANLTWGLGHKLPVSFIFNEHDYYTKKVRDQFELETSDADRRNKISKGNYAIIGSVIGSTFFPRIDVRSEDLNHFRVMKQHMSDYYASFAVQPWLLESADKVVLWLKESGLVQYHISDILHRRVGNELREVTIEHDGYVEGARVLKLTPLAAGFSMLIVGLCISSIVFYIELRSVSRKRSLCQVLNNIKRKRQLRRVMELKKKMWLSDYKRVK